MLAHGCQRQGRQFGELAGGAQLVAAGGDELAPVGTRQGSQYRIEIDRDRTLLLVARSNRKAAPTFRELVALDEGERVARRIGDAGFLDPAIIGLRQDDLAALLRRESQRLVE